MRYTLGTLDTLETEAIHIIREVAAEFENTVLLSSIGKDSMCMLHVTRKAFASGPLPFPLLEVLSLHRFDAALGSWSTTSGSGSSPARRRP